MKADFLSATRETGNLPDQRKKWRPNDVLLVCMNGRFIASHLRWFLFFFCNFNTLIKGQ